MNKKNVIVYGLGYVGLTLSIILAEKGFKVYGYDTDKNKINSLKKNKSYLHEKNISKKLTAINKKKDIIYINEINKKICAKYHVICVGTPLNKNKKPILSAVNNVLKDLCQIISKNDCIILRSTVPIGFTNNNVINKISQLKGYLPSKDYNICFAPERTVEGKALVELINNPQIIAGYSKKCLQTGINFFKNFTKKIILMKNLESAETAKLIDNTYRDNIFAFSNQISLICDKLGLDTLDIIKKCNLDYPRNNIPLPSPGVGGACLTKDPYILISSSNKKNINSNLILESRKTNNRVLDNLVKKIMNKLKQVTNPKILISGIAFKGYPENSDTRFSTSIDMIKKIKKLNNNAKIYVYDSIINKKSIEDLGYDYLNLYKTKKKLHAIILANNHKSFASIDLKKIEPLLLSPKLFCDCWGMLKNKNIKNFDKINYFGVGFEYINYRS